MERLPSPEAPGHREPEHLQKLSDLLDMIAAELGDPDAIDPVLTRVSMEAMRESERDPELRKRMAGMMREFRVLITELVRVDQKRGGAPTKAPASALATLIGAVGDGLLLHGLLDPELDVGEAIDSLRALLNR